MRLISIVVLLGIAATGVLGQDQPAAPREEVALEFGFDADAEGWTAMDDAALLTVAHEADEVKVGTGALRWEFEPTAGKMPGLAAQAGAAPNGQSFSMWMKSSVACLLAVGLQEAGGARYITASYCPADEWKKIEVALDDFMLSDDTTDDNDALDPDQIAACMVIDLAAMLLENPEAAMFLGMTTELRTILLDDFRVSPRPVARQRVVRDAAGGGREITLQTFDTSSIFLIPVRNTTAENVQYEDADGGAVALRYDLTGAQFPLAGAIMPVQLGELAGLDQVRVVVSSEQPMTLAVMIEEKENPAEGLDKSGYTATRTLAGGGEWETIELSPDDFKLNDDSSDENGALNGEQLSMIAIIDATAVAGGARTPANVLMIDEIAAVTTR